MRDAQEWIPSRKNEKTRSRMWKEIMDIVNVEEMPSLIGMEGF